MKRGLGIENASWEVITDLAGNRQGQLRWSVEALKQEISVWRQDHGICGQPKVGSQPH